MIRKIFGIVAGYGIFVVSSLMLFKYSRHDPHEEAGMFFMIFTIFFGMLFSFVAGAVAGFIDSKKGLAVNYMLAILIAGFALFSMIQSGGKHWTQFLAIFIFAPTSILGGIFYNKKSKK